MKKLTYLLLCIATLGMASCEKEPYYNQNANRSIVLNVAPNAWTLSNDGYTYYTVLNVPEIDQYTMDNEAVLVYLSYDQGASYLQLPFVYNIDSYSTVISKGKVEIDIQSSDNQDTQPIKPTSNVRVKVVIIAAQNVT